MIASRWLARCLPLTRGRTTFALVGALAFVLTLSRGGAAELFEQVAGTLASDTPLASDILRAEQLIAQGKAHAQAGRNAQALQAFQRAWRWDPTRDDALQPIPLLAAKLNRLDTAIRYALLVVRSNGTSPVRSDSALYRRLANHAAEQRDHALAAELWESLYETAGSGSRVQVRTVGETGRQWFLAGDAVEASDWFQKIAKTPFVESPSLDAVRLWEGVIACHLEAERFDRAKQAIHRLAEEPTKTGRAAYWQARLALQRNQPAVALERINKCFTSGDNGPNAHAYALLAEALRRTNQLDRSAEELKRFHNNRPNDPAAWLAWIDQLRIAGNKKEALVQANQLVEACLSALQTDGLTAWDNPTLAKGARRQIELLGSMNQAAQLWPSLEKLVGWWGSLEPVLEALEPILSRQTMAKQARVWLATSRPERMSIDALAIAGRVSLLLDQVEEAARFYKPLLLKCIAIDTDPPGDSPRVLDCWYGWLYDLIDLKAWPQVIDAITWAREQKVPQAQSADLSYWLTHGYIQTDQPEKALSSIRAARKISPEDLAYAKLETMLLANLDRFDEAIAVAQVGLKQAEKKNTEPNKTTRDLRLALALLLDRRADPADGEQAVELYETILDTWPLDPRTNNDLAFCWAERGVHLHRSLRMAQLAVEADSDNASYADTLGWVFYRLGRPEEAAEELRRAIRLISSDSESASYAVLYEHLAAALEATGDTDAAAQAKAERLRDLKDKNSHREHRGHREQLKKN